MVELNNIFDLTTNGQDIAHAERRDTEVSI